MTGRETEDIAIDCLEYHGYHVYQPPKAKYREQDVFGLFDLLAFGHDRELRIQVKGGRDASGIQSWFRQARHFEEHLTDIEVQFWHRKQDCWRIAVAVPDGYGWVFDGRDAYRSDYSRLRDLLRG